MPLVPTPQPKQGQNLDGTLKASYPTPGNDVTYEAELAYNVDDYIQTVYGNPPPEGTHNDQMLVSEVVVDWQLVKRLYAADRANEDAYNASISYGQEASAFPTFTRDYVVRRYNYAPKTKLTPLTGIVSAAVTNGGSGYATSPTVTLTGGTGSGGAITAIINAAGVVTNLAISSVGNYTVAPTLGFSGGGGTGAAGTCAVQPATALLTKEDALRQPDNRLDGLYIFVRRIYETLPGPIVAGTHIDDQSGIVVDFTKQVVAAGTVTSGIIGAGVLQLNILNAGSGFTSAPTLSLSGGGGTGATATCTVDTSSAGDIGSLTLTNPGAGYTAAPGVSITSGTGTGATAHAALVPTSIASLSLSAGGSGYLDQRSLSVSITDGGGIGFGATGTATLTPTTVASAAPAATGTGYTMATVTVTGGGGTGAAFTANIVGTSVTSYTRTNAGSGYTSPPDLAIVGDGTGALAVATLTGTSVATITLTGGGSNYSSPSVAIAGSGGSGATVIAVLTPTNIDHLVLDASGSGYSDASVGVSGGGGGGAAATANILAGFINATMITNAGTGYTAGPTVTISGGGGDGSAILGAVIGGLTFVDYEPVTAIKGIKMTQTVDLTTLPPDRSFPGTFRVSFKDSGGASIIYAFAQNYASGMVENTLHGGSGPELVTIWERWMTESAFSAYVSPFKLSKTGVSRAYTLVNDGIYNDIAYVFTFRPTPLDEGTGAGLLDLTNEEWRLKIRKVKEIVLGHDV